MTCKRVAAIAVFAACLVAPLTVRAGQTPVPCGPACVQARLQGRINAHQARVHSAIVQGMVERSLNDRLNAQSQALEAQRAMSQLNLQLQLSQNDATLRSLLEREQLELQILELQSRLPALPKAAASPIPSPKPSP